MESDFFIIYLAAKLNRILHRSADGKCWIQHVN